MAKKLFIKTYGCKMNDYDSARIIDLLKNSHGFTVTSEMSEADFIILNTCSVRQKATEKVYSELGRLKLLKNACPDLIIALGGCVSMEEKENVFRRAPHVNIVFGPQNLHSLPAMYDQAIENEKKLIDVSFQELKKFEYFANNYRTFPDSHLSIMEGCNKFCSYCIVPYTRGKETSREFNEIISEIRVMIDNGLEEIHLLGQNVNAYQDPTNGANLAKLLEKIITFDRVKRIRFTTSHPIDLSDTIIDLFSNEKLANHLHLPVQSGSNRILNLMRRGYTREQYETIIEKLRCRRPNLSISSDFIVGFPGETEEDFQQTMDIIQSINFDNSFSFIYSKRPGTEAAKFEDSTPLNEKKNRLAILQNQLALQARRYSNQMLGTIQEVLITENCQNSTNRAMGKTSNYRTVIFPFQADNTINKIVKIKIIKILPNSLVGELVN